MMILFNQVKKPHDVELRIKLLRLYLVTKPVDDAYNNAVETDRTTAFTTSLDWYECLHDVFKVRCAAAGFLRKKSLGPTSFHTYSKQQQQIHANFSKQTFKLWQEKVTFFAYFCQKRPVKMLAIVETKVYNRILVKRAP
jgi:hypothetical protein